MTGEDERDVHRGERQRRPPHRRALVAVMVAVAWVVFVVVLAAVFRSANRPDGDTTAMLETTGGTDDRVSSESGEAGGSPSADRSAHTYELGDAGLFSPGAIAVSEAESGPNATGAASAVGGGGPPVDPAAGTASSADAPLPAQGPTRDGDEQRSAAAGGEAPAPTTTPASGGGGSTSGTTPTTTGPSSGPSGGEAPPTTRPAPSGSAAPPACPSGGQEATVRIQGRQYSPAAITVTRCTIVTMVNDDRQTHTWTFDDGNYSVRLERGQRTSRLFEAAGRFAYRCTVHDKMTGVVTVT